MSVRVVIVNETLATAYWPNTNPIGQCATYGRDSTCSEVVGAVRRHGLLGLQRTHETSIRMALGARRRDVVRLVALQATRAVGAGAAVGDLVAVLASRCVGDLLFETSPHDPLAYTGAAAALALAAVLCDDRPGATFGGDRSSGSDAGRIDQHASLRAASPACVDDLALIVAAEAVRPGEIQDTD